MISYTPEIRPSCKKDMQKTGKKNPVLQKVLEAKMQEVLQQPHHYKPLQHDLAGIRRVHILKSFVLTYAIHEEKKTVEFIAFSHHDDAYKR